MIEYTEKSIDEVLNIDTTEELHMPVGDTVETMSLYTVARWLALINGISTIDKKAAQLKIDLDKDKTWVKPLALQKFVDEATPSCIAQVKTLKTEKECTT